MSEDTYTNRLLEVTKEIKSTQERIEELVTSFVMNQMYLEKLQQERMKIICDSVKDHL